MAHSTTDTCKNCAKCGKGFNIGTNVAYNIKIKIRLGGISKISAFVPMPIWLPQTKAFHWRRNSWKNFYLTSQIKCNHWKERTKLVQNDLRTILIGWIVAEIFDLENTPKLLTGQNQHLFDIFLRNSISHNSTGISPIDLFHGSFWISFQSSFQLWDLYCE